METAAKEVTELGLSIRASAKKYQICHVTLSRFVKSMKNNEKPASGYKPHSKVFDTAQELILCKYVLDAADLYYGLTTKDVRKLAYQCAVTYQLKFPDNWSEFEMAGIDWLRGFLKRCPNLSLRKPEPTSLARAMNFNRNNVNSFFNNLSDVYVRYEIEPQNVYNVDEMGITTVQVPTKIAAKKGKKQVGAITSSERGTLVTCCVAVNATGNSIPPFLIFPRQKFYDHFIRDGPPGCIGAANGSGWMQAAEFLQFLHHFAKHVKPSKVNVVLLLLDNHDSHLYIPSIKFCQDNGIILLSFPPHCSHRLQPLDVSVYGPLKRYVNVAMDSWIKNHPEI
nr:MFS-type transporter clz9-like [Parasteatoda tepidariorum]